MRAYLKMRSLCWCEHAGCQAGAQVVHETGVYQCSYPTRKEAEEAAKKLRPHFKRGIVKVGTGQCPIAEAYDNEQ